MEHKCNGCQYKGTHQEMMFRPFGVCLRETNLIQAEKNYNADVCPYKDKRKEDAGEMKENKIYCDHCGKEIDPVRDYDDLQIDMGHKWYNTDLCIECLDNLYDIVLNFCKKQDHPTEKGGEE